MSDTDQPFSDASDVQIDLKTFQQLVTGISDMQSAWDAFRQLTTEDGVTLEAAWSRWAEVQKQGLQSPGAQTDFIELCQAGCVPELLASILWLIRFASRVNELWSQTLGRADKRQKALVSLAKAAEALKEYYREFQVPGSANQTKDPTKIEHGFFPLRIVTEIQSHNDMWVLFNRLAAKFNANSMVEFGKYLFVAYVQGTTGRFRDRNVSALLGEILGPIDYDEVAHRMWRNRNYERLQQGLFIFSDPLLELSLVLSCRT